MSFEIPGFSYTLIAAADLSAKQYYFVDVDSNGKAALPTAQGQRVAGVLQNKPKSGEAGTVVRSGITMVICSAAINAGADVTTANDGRAVTATTGNKIYGIALKATTAAGQYVPVLLASGANVA